MQRKLLEGPNNTLFGALIILHIIIKKTQTQNHTVRDREECHAAQYT